MKLKITLLVICILSGINLSAQRLYKVKGLKHIDASYSVHNYGNVYAARLGYFIKNNQSSFLMLSYDMSSFEQTFYDDYKFHAGYKYNQSTPVSFIYVNIAASAYLGSQQVRNENYSTKSNFIYGFSLSPEIEVFTFPNLSLVFGGTANLNFNSDFLKDKYSADFSLRYTF